MENLVGVELITSITQLKLESIGIIKRLLNSQFGLLSALNAFLAREILDFQFFILTSNSRGDLL